MSFFDPQNPGIDLHGSGGGSGGFLELDPSSGLVNGTNTQFVFSSKPTYIVSDHAWYKENVGWTWNTGTSTATMTIPPNDDIYGFV